MEVTSSATEGHDLVSGHLDDKDKHSGAALYYSDPLTDRRAAVNTMVLSSVEHVINIEAQTARYWLG